MNANPTVSTAWLAQHLDDPQVRIVDASWHMPATLRDAAAEFLRERIPGAVFFDIDRIADRDCALPHMLPAEAEFDLHMRRLGIGAQTRVIVYDSVGLLSAARAWWMLRVFGHDRVAVLDGGLPAWRTEGRPLASGEEPGVTPAPMPPFTARRDAALVRSAEQVLTNVHAAVEQLVDARPPGRFAGLEPEPRAELRAGAVPGSINLPFAALLEPGGQRLLPPQRLRAAFEAAGVDLTRPIATTCGSGITACILALALQRISIPRVAVYDGSWAEWGGRADLPAVASGRTPA